MAFRLDDGQDPEQVKARLFEIIRQWVRGATFAEIAQLTLMDADDILGIHTRAVAYSLQTLVEQDVSLLARLLLERGIEVSEGGLAFVEHLKFGVPSRFWVLLANGGVRHRKAYVALGNAIQALTPPIQPTNAKAVALRSVKKFSRWMA